METLDQLLGGDVPLPLVRGWFGSDERFIGAVEAMLLSGEVRLVTGDTEAPRWQWAKLLRAACDRHAEPIARLFITADGVRRIERGRAG